MVEREDTVEFNVTVPERLFGQLERLRTLLGEEHITFYVDVLEKGGAVKEVDQVYDQVVSIINDENQSETTLFEFMERGREGSPVPFEPKIIPFIPRKE